MIKINYAFTVSSCAKCDNNIQEKASRKITTLVLRGVSKLVRSLKSVDPRGSPVQSRSKSVRIFLGF